MRSSRFLLLCAVLALVCVGAALGADALFTRLILRSNSVEAARVGRVIENRGEPGEIPIFGASKASADYIPDVLGPGYFNYGFPSASPDVTNLLLAFEIQHKSTQPIVVDVHQTAFTDIGDVRNFIPFARTPQVKALLKKTNNWRWYYGVPGLRYYGSFDWYLKGIITDHVQVTHRVVRGYSYEFNALAWSKDQFERDVAKRHKIPTKFGMYEDQRQTFLALIRSAPNRKFIIVLAPLHRSFLDGATGEAEYMQEMAEFRSLPNVQLLDFTHTDYPDQAFRDTGHLNLEGARVFSSELRGLIESGGSRP